MKLFGAVQPHRADSNYWNDSFGGRTINKNYRANSNTITNSNRLSNNSNKTNSETNQIKTANWREGEPRQLCGRDEWRGSKFQEGLKTKSMGILVSDMIQNTPKIVANMMRILQSLQSLQSSNLFLLVRGERRRHFHFGFSPSFWLFFILSFLCVFTNRALCDENESGSSMGPAFTTLSMVTIPTIPPFDNATRGNKKFGDRCEDTVECGFPGSVCDPRKKSCQCIEDLPVTNHLDKCGKEAAINESCFFNEQCEAFHFQTECRSNRCACRFDMSPIVNKDGNVECKGKQMKHDEVERYVDPAMIGVLVGMALMFIIICVVLRLFSRARWRENRTIFNTPNPRLMNVSLLRDNKLMHGQERRGSRMSVRAPSRQPSMASLRPHSPNPSLGSRPGSRGSSNASATSARSTLVASAHADAKPTANNNCADHNPSLIITNIIENPAAESVTIEILQPKSNQNQ